MMRFLIYAPILNDRVMIGLDFICSNLLEKKQTFHIITKEQALVLQNTQFSLSKNQKNIQILKKKFTEECITLLLSDLSIKPLKCDNIFKKHNSLVIDNIVTSFKPDSIFTVTQNTDLKIKNNIYNFEQTDHCKFLVNNNIIKIIYQNKNYEVDIAKNHHKYEEFFNNISTTELKKKSLKAVNNYRKKYKQVTVKTSRIKRLNDKKNQLPIHLTKGEIESLKDNDVLFDNYISIRGWVDFSNQDLKALIVNINDKPHRIYPNLLRGELIEELGNYNILGYDEKISLEGLGSRLKIEVFLMNKGGKEFRWKKLFLWSNHSTPKIYTNPILSGDVLIEKVNNVYKCIGNITVENLTEYHLELWQYGQKIHEYYPKKSIKNFTFNLPDSLNLQYPIYVWIILHNKKCFWKRIKIKDIEKANDIKIIQPPLGYVVENGQLEIIGQTAEPSKLLINGKIINNNVKGKFDLIVDVSAFPNQLYIELCNLKYCSSAFCWNHREKISFENDNFCINIPSESIIQNKKIKRSINLQNILLIRQNKAPTDELYVLASIKELEKKSKINLKIVNLDDEEDPEKYKNFLNGCHVIISRYITSSWLNMLTTQKNVIEKIYYLMDDDVGGAVDSIWMPGGYRQRMIKVSNGEFQSLLAISDRFIATSKFIYNRYFSKKTDLLEPPYLNNISNLSHLDKTPIVISYHATQVHRDDLLFIADILRNIHNKYVDVQIQIVMGNYIPGQLKNLERVHMVNGMNWDEYKVFMKNCTAHISLAPLLDTAYNRGKSIIKLFDISRLGALGVYTNTFPYNEVIENGKNGFLLENDPLVWENILSYLIENPKLIKEIATKAQEDAMKIGSLNKINQYWNNQLGIKK